PPDERGGNRYVRHYSHRATSRLYAKRKPTFAIGSFRFCAGFRIPALMIYPPVLRAGVRKPSGKEPAGGGIGGLLSMGICRGSVLGRGCTGRRNGWRTEDRVGILSPRRP